MHLHTSYIFRSSTLTGSCCSHILLLLIGPASNAPVECSHDVAPRSSIGSVGGVELDRFGPCGIRTEPDMARRASCIKGILK